MNSSHDALPENGDIPITAMSTSELFKHCQNHLSGNAHEPFCLELFRRAIGERCNVAWYCIYTHYYALVRYWVGLRSVSDADTQDDLVQEAFVAFWNYYTTEKLAQATGLASVLAYLKSCAFTAVAQWQRRQKLNAVPLLDEIWNTPTTDTPEFAIELGAIRETLLARLDIHCVDARERLVLLYIFLEELKPAALVERYPQEFPEVQEVYRIKRNLLGRLQRDPELRAMCENS